VRSAIGPIVLFAMLMVGGGCNRNGRPRLPGQPAITVEDVAADIVGKGPNEGLTGWLFKPDEQRDVQLVDVAYEEGAAAATISVKTEWTRPGNTWRMAGRIRVHYRWRDRQWRLTRLENITFKRI
jgi:hypothetical protein